MLLLAVTAIASGVSLNLTHSMTIRMETQTACAPNAGPKTGTTLTQTQRRNTTGQDGALILPTSHYPNLHTIAKQHNMPSYGYFRRKHDNAVKRGKKGAYTRWNQYHKSLSCEQLRVDPPDVRLTVFVKTAWDKMTCYQLRGMSMNRTAIFRDGLCVGTGGKAALFRMAERETITRIMTP